MKPRHYIPIAVWFAFLTVIYAPSCAIPQQTPEAQAAGLDFSVLTELIPALINSDQLSVEGRIVLLETAKTATTDPRIIARIEREIARQRKKLEKPEPETPNLGNTPSFFQEVRWLRGDTTGPDAVVTKRLSGLALNGDRITFDPLDIPDWPAGSLGGDLKGVMCVAALRDGVWVGGKFEHIRNGMRDRHLVNVHNGYLPGLSLRRGETLRFWILSYDGRQASNIAEAVWQ